MSEKIEDLLRQMSLRRPPPELDDAIARQLADTGGDALVVAPPAERYGWGGWLATAVGCLLLGWVAGRSTAPLAAHKPPPATEALAGRTFTGDPPRGQSAWESDPVSPHGMPSAGRPAATQVREESLLRVGEDTLLRTFHVVTPNQNHFLLITPSPAV